MGKREEDAKNWGSQWTYAQGIRGHKCVKGAQKSTIKPFVYENIKQFFPPLPDNDLVTANPKKL